MKPCKKTAIIIALSLISTFTSLLLILYLLYVKLERMDQRILGIQKTLDESEVWKVVDEN